MNDLSVMRRLRQYPKQLFSVRDLQKILGVKPGSLRTVIMRLKQRNVLVSVTQGWYTMFGSTLTPEEAATHIYYPSYISLKTVLSREGIINQIPRPLYLVTVRKTHTIPILGVETIFRQITSPLFFGYHTVNNIPIAYPEKALLDTIYYVSYGRETLDFDDLDVSRLNHKRWNRLKSLFPPRIQRYIEKAHYIP
jgi:predicted transcriptional regulator of viral defense system